MAKINVRARTVDMLGRQQIAGIATAINELFKNAHDAYAKNVIVDYHRKDKLFILRDDGLGMTREDFENRWLTLGTESKLGKTDLEPPPHDPSQPKRSIMGEKGIGRLAIAAIGSQLLVLTRAKRNDTLHDLVYAFINWSIFTIPGLNLSQIEIPVQECKNGKLPTKEGVQDLLDSFKKNLEDSCKGYKGDELDSILHDIESFDVDPNEWLELLDPPNLDDDGHGTHFFIKPTDVVLNEEIDRESAYQASNIQKMLTGFSNTFTSEEKDAVINSRFRDHLPDGRTNDIISGKAFFDYDDFKSADHHVSGRFDAFGQFKGAVTVYGEKPKLSVIPWLETKGVKTKCGPFQITFAYVQGELKQTKLPALEHARMTSKLDKIGGLYIYKDGIRILPYGDSDYDWLSIERRRTLSASYYYFSYRRIFGAVEISHKHNSALHEKAGREGFRENLAYRQLKAILENFFLQLATQYFREGGLEADLFLEVRAELEHAHEVRKKRAKQTRKRKADFYERLDAVFRSINDRLPETHVKDLEDDLVIRLETIKQIEDLNEAAVSILDIESEYRERLDQIREKCIVRKPRIGISKQKIKEWNIYLNEFKRLDEELFVPAARDFEDYVGELAKEAQLAVDMRKRLDKAIDSLSSRLRSSANKQGSEARKELRNARKRALELTNACLKDFEDTVQHNLANLSRLNTSKWGEDRYSDLRSSIENKINLSFEENSTKLASLRNQLLKVATTEGMSEDELIEVLETDLNVIREEHERELEMAQLGMALGIIQHEFNAAVKGINDGLEILERWADSNEQLGDLYDKIRVNFDHLESYLSLFAPLNRRLESKETIIYGSEVLGFIKELFDTRLERHGIELEATQSFNSSEVIGSPSTFYPVFVNLVDNSIYWLGTVQQNDKSITLDFINDCYMISDNGPGIENQFRSSVFEFGFSRKPGGKGMGLYIAKQVLDKIDFEISLGQYKKGSGATFRVCPKSFDE